MKISVLGIDLAKQVFQLHDVDEQGVPGELILKPLREANRVRGSESANETYPTWSAICQRI